MQILSASQPAQTEKGEWVTGGEGRTLLVDALETVTKDNPQQTLHQWLHGVEEQLPRTFKQLYPGLKDESVSTPCPAGLRRKIYSYGRCFSIVTTSKYAVGTIKKEEQGFGRADPCDGGPLGWRPNTQEERSSAELKQCGAPRHKRSILLLEIRRNSAKSWLLGN